MKTVFNISGPYAVGKDSILNAVLAAYPEATQRVSTWTTRPVDPELDPSYHRVSFDEMADWRKVYEEFLALKQQCGEPTANLTFEKFKGTLQRNKDALVARHNCTRVKFTVYVKEGKAALKASPVK